ncbi:nucleotidyltransferase family protein [Pontixanthobacter aestiaquae]|uniref:NTP transferase domain-containing protein n=1 Tax=Pontixanthobacter aestiaquae TaxID=1509367 RepID=A0A844Z4Q9_9SPHN|nr:nucleotidyltransferase family protein [Pontixanthobacter aestiaquae]MDN3647224.1 nucleotidyltransferase family protein [Pontixanthobacter aestiaquae]MXO81800.1 NTP transferase domain-containing protein [Pontixanthobacter aestiaquae]
MPRASNPNICLAILAAGQSRRFGEADKLVQLLNGRMLGVHVAATLASLNVTSRMVITSAGDHPCADEWSSFGYGVAVNKNASQGLGTSVAMAAHVAMDFSADALLVCLADMPFVPVDHFERLIDTFQSNDGAAIIASYGGTTVSPPALFDKTLFAKLAEFDGNTGARNMLSSATRVLINPDLLADIDTPEQLRKANAGAGFRSD